ncbi:tRNA adenosine(34) deaminase TadA [Ectothiorhodospiraceae bacterium BW-2]|nr:tRNA adenosine(34) deaminase TadA [Ectothiorhodospiraceae bacterium BW-2]
MRAPLSLPSPDHYWMGLALQQAHLAAAADEVPVGALLIQDNNLLAAGYNQPIRRCDPTAHAEIVVLRQAAKRVGNYRLPATTLYTTLEPCPMCAGAILHARIRRVVFATADPRSGCGGSLYSLLDDPRFNHRCQVTAHILQPQSAQLLREFFRKRRKN